MRVRMSTQIQGTRNGAQWPAAGDEIVVPDAEGAQLCANGYAEPVAEVEQAETRPARRAVKRNG